MVGWMGYLKQSHHTMSKSQPSPFFKQWVGGCVAVNVADDYDDDDDDFV